MWGNLFKPLRVLVVDDNADTAYSLAILVRLWGHEALMAADGAEALAASRLHRPDAILLDIGLPRINGYDVAQYLRSHAELGRPLLIAITGYGRNEDRTRALEI